MPHTPGAVKRLRQSETRRKRNRAASKKIRRQRKAAEFEIDKVVPRGNQSQSQAEYRATQAMLDRAANKGYIHPNHAARLKSRLVKRLRALSGEVISWPKAVEYVGIHSPKLLKPPALVSGVKFVRDAKRVHEIRKMFDQLPPPMSLAKQASLQRAENEVFQKHPHSYVVYLDIWTGDELERRVLAVSLTLAECHKKMRELPTDVRKAAQTTHTPPGGNVCFVPTLFVASLPH